MGGITMTLTAPNDWPTDPRPARASLAIKHVVLTMRPHLDPAGFGMIGDAAHAARVSDHNPELHHLPNGDPYWIVRAIDVPLKVGDGNRRFAEAMRREAHGSRKVKPHPAFGTVGYIISDHRIASHRTGWRWIAYHGTDPHTGHVHLSWGRRVAAFDSTAPFHLHPADVGA
jgi:hypothetical protein